MNAVIRIGITFSVLIMIGSAAAQELEQDYTPQREIPPPIKRQARDEPILWRPCLGAGYIPYAYPGLGSCPCDDERCFSAARYYCGGKPYRRHWFGKWVRAHLGHGSMLEDYPCQCTYAAVGRPRLLATNPDASAVEDVLPPVGQ